MSAGSKTNSRDGENAWQPGAAHDVLRSRATLLADLRAYFAAAGVLEVETPLVCRSGGTDPAIEPLQTCFTGPGSPHGTRLYLQTSPEFAMKRLLAAGSGPIYQICKAFRDGEAGRLHNPEFSILEWYRPDWAADRLIDELIEVVRLALGRPVLAVERRRYAELFASQLDVDVFELSAAQLQAVAIGRGVADTGRLELDRDGWLDLLFSHLIQPSLGAGALCLVSDFPASQAALARLNPDSRTAARFELFWHGVELANGFDELTDVDEQAARFEADNCRRRALGLAPVRVDRRLLGAMEQGLPPCSGVAVGIDRLLMLRLGLNELDAVMSFSLQRC